MAEVRDGWAISDLIFGAAAQIGMCTTARSLLTGRAWRVCNVTQALRNVIARRVNGRLWIEEACAMCECANVRCTASLAGPGRAAEAFAFWARSHCYSIMVDREASGAAWQRRLRWMHQSGCASPSHPLATHDRRVSARRHQQRRQQSEGTRPLGPEHCAEPWCRAAARQR